MYRTWSKAI